MWKPVIGKGIRSAAKQPLAAQVLVRSAPRAEEAATAGRTRVQASVLVVAAGAASLAALLLFASAASSQTTKAKGPTKALHVTKDCSGSRGVAGDFCTIRSSNVPALKVGSRIFYLQSCCKTELDSDTAIYAGPGALAAGHCLLHYATGTGLCTFSDGTGALAGFQARVRVTADSSIPSLWHWDGTYSFNHG
jgi:hypothetical protein